MPKLILDGDAKGAVSAHADLDKAATKTKGHYKELGEESGRAGQKHKEAFGSEAVKDLGNVVAGVFALDKALELVVEGFQEVKRESEAAANRATSALAASGQLLAVSGAKGPANLAMARSITATGIADDSQSAQIVAAWQKAHLSDQEEQFLKSIGSRYVVGAGELGEFGADIQGFNETFEGKAGSVQDIAKKFIRAAADTKGTPAELAKMIERAAPDAAANGMSADETLAAYSVFGRSAPTAKMAGSRLSEYLKGERDFTPTQQQQYNQELIAIRGAPGGEVPDGVNSDPELRNARQAIRAKGMAVDAWRTEGGIENLYNAMVSQSADKAKEESGYAAYLLNRAGGFVGGLTLGSERMQLQNVMDDPKMRGQLDNELQQAILDELKRQTNHMTEESIPPGRAE